MWRPKMSEDQIYVSPEDGANVEAEKGEDHIYVLPEDGANVKAKKGWIWDRKGQKIQKVLNTFLNGWMMQVCRSYCETTTMIKK